MAILLSAHSAALPLLAPETLTCLICRCTASCRPLHLVVVTTYILNSRLRTPCSIIAIDWCCEEQRAPDMRRIAAEKEEPKYHDMKL